MEKPRGQRPKGAVRWNAERGCWMSKGTPTRQEAEIRKAWHWPGIICDCGNHGPIIGNRYKKVGADFDLCEAAYRKRSEDEKSDYVCMPPRSADGCKLSLVTILPLPVCCSGPREERVQNSAQCTQHSLPPKKRRRSEEPLAHVVSAAAEAAAQASTPNGPPTLEELEEGVPLSAWLAYQATKECMGEGGTARVPCASRGIGDGRTPNRTDHTPPRRLLQSVSERSRSVTVYSCDAMSLRFLYTSLLLHDRDGELRWPLS